MRAKLKIIRYRKQYPLKPSNQIAKEVGVSRQYVHKILKKAGLPTSAPRPFQYKYSCNQCQVVLRYTGKKGSSKVFCSSSCKDKYRNISVKCSFCRLVFTRKRSRLTWAAKAGYNRIYCSKQCQYKGWRLDGLKHAN